MEKSNEIQKARAFAERAKRIKAERAIADVVRSRSAAAVPSASGKPNDGQKAAKRRPR